MHLAWANAAWLPGAGLAGLGRVPNTPYLDAGSVLGEEPEEGKPGTLLVSRTGQSRRAAPFLHRIAGPSRIAALRHAPENRIVHPWH